MKEMLLYQIFWWVWTAEAKLFTCKCWLCQGHIQGDHQSTIIPIERLLDSYCGKGQSLESFMLLFLTDLWILEAGKDWYDVMSQAMFTMNGLALQVKISRYQASSSLGLLSRFFLGTRAIMLGVACGLKRTHSLNLLHWSFDKNSAQRPL